MIREVVGVAGVIALFMLFGWLQWSRPHRGCGNCSCGGDTCERTGEPHPHHHRESFHVDR